MHTPFQVTIKPAGPTCNLDCKYCYYLEKERLYPGGHGIPAFRMADEVVERLIVQKIESDPGPVVTFDWQGGEPTLLGLDFFRRMVALQNRHCLEGKRVTNTIQTNGTLLDAEWAQFLKENAFLVGISIDGPAELHDRLRYNKAGAPTFNLVMRGLRLLQDAGVDYNVLTTVNAVNVQHPTRVYEFLVGAGARYLQFIPVVVRDASSPSGVSQESVTPKAYGAFLCAIFGRWIRRDLGYVFVQLFDNTLSIWMGLGSTLCVFAPECGRSLAVEHNGDLYSCDHFVDPEHRLGNIRELSLIDLAESTRQRRFGEAKRVGLPRCCRECDVRFACNGECPKNRFAKTLDGEDGLNYLCAAYKNFYHEVAPYMALMAAELRAGRPAAGIVPWLEPNELARPASGGEPQ